MRTIARLVTWGAVAALSAVTLAATDTLSTPVRGTVADTSGAVLPGVSVTATAPGGATLDASTTDAQGSFVLSHVASPHVTLTFELDGFSSTSMPVVMKPGAEPWVAAVLTLAPRTETVVVHGTLPLEPARITSMPTVEPMPVLEALPAHDKDSICGPSMPDSEPILGRLTSVKGDAKRQLYAQGDLIVVDGGTQSGLQAGGNYVVRRKYRVRGTGRDAMVEHTAGVVQIVSADERHATAAVVYACDVLMRGDRLAAFNPEMPRQPEPFGTPAFDDAAHIVLGDSGQQLGSPRRLMVIDRGTDASLRLGQTLTLFRREGGAGDSASIVGAAVIVALREHSATIRVDQGRDAIDVGDWAAPQRYEP